MSEDYFSSSQDDTYNIEHRYLIMMVTARVNYHHSRNVCIYSRIGAGFNAHREEVSNIQGDPSMELTNPRDFAWQWDVIGLNIGNDLSFFAELSIGVITLFKCGMSYNF